MRPKTIEEIQHTRIAGGRLAQVLDVLKNSITSGMTTQDLDDIAREELKKLGGNVQSMKNINGNLQLVIAKEAEDVHFVQEDELYVLIVSEY